MAKAIYALLIQSEVDLSVKAITFSGRGNRLEGTVLLNLFLFFFESVPQSPLLLISPVINESLDLFFF